MRCGPSGSRHSTMCQQIRRLLLDGSYLRIRRPKGRTSHYRPVTNLLRRAVGFTLISTRLDSVTKWIVSSRWGRIAIGGDTGRTTTLFFCRILTAIYSAWCSTAPNASDSQFPGYERSLASLNR